MPFGLTNPPAIFQAIIIDALRDFLDHFVYVYIDNILIYSPDLDTHKHHVSQVLKRLLDNHLYVKAEKKGVPCRHHLLPGIYHSPWKGADGSG